jgi:hypothetical protein
VSEDILIGTLAASTIGLLATIIAYHLAFIQLLMLNTGVTTHWWYFMPPGAKCQVGEKGASVKIYFPKNLRRSHLAM